MNVVKKRPLRTSQEMRRKVLVTLFSLLTLWTFSLGGTISAYAGPLRKAYVEDPDAKIPAQAFELEDLKNKKVRLDDFRGKVVLLVFWTTW